MREIADRAARRRREERGESRPEDDLLAVDCPGGRAFVDPDSLAYDLAGNSYGSTITWGDHSSGVVQAYTADGVSAMDQLIDGSWIRARPHVIEDLAEVR